MNLFSRIAIGTANFGKEYNGVKVSEKDIEKILGYAQCSGIDMLDCATAYGWNWTQANSYFKKVVKVRKGDDIEKVAETEPYCIMAHNFSFYSELLEIDVGRGTLGHVLGASIYKPCEVNDIWGSHIIQVPYSLYDRRFESKFLTDKSKFDFGKKVHEIHVRSIFLRGKIIQDGIPPEECIKFCLCNPYVDRVIIGVESFEQLQRNLDFLHRWKNLEKHDLELLDTRKW